MGEHVGDKGLHAVQHAIKIDPHHPLPISVWCFPNRYAAVASCNASVIKDQVHIAEGLSRFVQQILHRGFDHGVSNYSNHTGLTLFDLHNRLI